MKPSPELFAILNLTLWLGNIIRDHKEWYVFNNKYREEILLKGIIKGGSSLTRQSYCQIHVELYQTRAIYLSIHRWTFVLCTLGLTSNLIFSQYECCYLLSETKEINRTKQKCGNWNKTRIELWTKGRELDLCFLLYNDDIRFTGLLREDVELIHVALDKMGHKSDWSLRNSIRINSLH